MINNDCTITQLLLESSSRLITLLGRARKHRPLCKLVSPLYNTSITVVQQSCSDISNTILNFIVNVVIPTQNDFLQFGSSTKIDNERSDELCGKNLTWQHISNETKYQNFKGTTQSQVIIQ